MIHFFKKLWELMQKSWKYIVGFIVAIIAIVLTTSKKDEGFDILKRHRKDQKDLDRKVDKILAGVDERNKRIDEETQKRIAEIEEKLKEKNEKLEQSKKDEIKKIVRETDGNPGELAKRLSELTGLSVSKNDVE